MRKPDATAGVGEVSIRNFRFGERVEKNSRIDVGCYRPPEARNIGKESIMRFTQHVEGVRGDETDSRQTADPGIRPNTDERPPEEKREPIVVPEDSVKLVSDKPAVPGTEIMTLPKKLPGNVVRRLAGSEDLVEEFRGVTE
jgi:hypothetical protein